MNPPQSMSFEQWLVVGMNPLVFDVVCIGGPVLLAVLGFFLVRRIFPAHMLKEHHDVASALFNTLGTVYGIFLAFVVATTWQFYNTTATNVNDEALHLQFLYDNANAFAPDFRTKIQQDLQDYRRIVVDDEWKALAEGRWSPKAGHLLRDMTTLYTSYKPQTDNEQAFFAESVKSLNILKELREERISDASSGLIPLLWFVLIAGAVVTIGFTFLFGSRSIYAQAIMTVMLSAVISLTLFTIVNLDFPFSGEVAIPPTPFVNLPLH